MVICISEDGGRSTIVVGVGIVQYTYGFPYQSSLSPVGIHPCVRPHKSSAEGWTDASMFNTKEYVGATLVIEMANGACELSISRLANNPKSIDDADR